jgi:hypothetical protein
MLYRNQKNFRIFKSSNFLSNPKYVVKHSQQDDNVPAIHSRCQIHFSFQQEEPWKEHKRKIMWKTIVIICACYAVAFIKLATPFQLSLMDYKACQERSNCSKNLQPSDCSRGSYLDPHMGESGCCHGCRKGIGERKNLSASFKKN